MASIFISYGRESRPVAATLAHDIEDLGHTAWFDQDIGAGHLWWGQILAQVRECDIFLYALDPPALTSIACQREHAYAKALGKAVIPVLVSDKVSPSLLPPDIAAIQYVDYRERSPESVISLGRALFDAPASPTLPDPLPVPPEQPPPRPEAPVGLVVWIIRAAKLWMQNSAHRMWERAVTPKTRLGAALRAAIVGGVFYSSSLVVVDSFWPQKRGEQSPLLLFTLWGIAGGIAGRNRQATFGGLAVLAASMLGGVGAVWWLARYGTTLVSFGQALLLGAKTAALVAIVIIAWQTARALRASYRQATKPKSSIHE